MWYHDGQGKCSKKIGIIEVIINATDEDGTSCYLTASKDGIPWISMGSDDAGPAFRTTKEATDMADKYIFRL